jgi:hypothetical protein
MKNPNHAIGNRTSDMPGGSTVPHQLRHDVIPKLFCFDIKIFWGCTLFCLVSNINLSDDHKAYKTLGTIYPVTQRNIPEELCVAYSSFKSSICKV